MNRLCRGEVKSRCSTLLQETQLPHPRTEEEGAPWPLYHPLFLNSPQPPELTPCSGNMFLCTPTEGSAISSPRLETVQLNT